MRIRFQVATQYNSLPGGKMQKLIRLLNTNCKEQSIGDQVATQCNLLPGGNMQKLIGSLNTNCKEQLIQDFIG